MDKLDSYQTLHKLFLSHKHPIPLKVLVERLECSEKTVRRMLEQMRDLYAAPIQYCPEQRGWQYQPEQQGQFQLPGIWLTSTEVQSLGLLIQLLNGLGEGILGEELAVIETYINQLLKTYKIPRSKFDQLIKVIPITHRQLANPIFGRITEALINHKQLNLHYRSYNQQKTSREISPQTLVYYRENWYLDAWCHLRKGLRTFSLARIDKVSISDKPAARITSAELEAHFSQGYGIFSGAAAHRATLRFHPEIAHEIALQQWHPSQQGRWQGEDYLLTIPYSDSRELVQDILRHVPNVSIDEPDSLREEVQTRLKKGLQRLQISKSTG